MKNRMDSSAGFNEGYNSKNIAILEETLYSELIELEKNSWLLFELAREKSAFSGEMERIYALSATIQNRNINVIRRLLDFGMALIKLYELSGEDFKNQFKEKLKSIMIKYIETCEKSKNNELIEQALKLDSVI